MQRSRDGARFVRRLFECSRKMSEVYSRNNYSSTVLLHWQQSPKLQMGNMHWCPGAPHIVTQGIEDSGHSKPAVTICHNSVRLNAM